MRVRRKNSARQGTVVGELPNGDVWVEWDEDPQQRWQISPDLLVETDDLAVMPVGAKAPASVELRILDMLDRLRDGINIQIESYMNDIRRLMKQK